MSNAGVGARKKVIVDKAVGLIRGIKEARPKIRGSLQRHMATGAILLGTFRVIKAARIVAGNAAEQIGVVMVLAPEEFLVLRHLVGEADLVTDGTELGRAHEGFEEGLLVKLRLGLDQKLVERAQRGV